MLVKPRRGVLLLIVLALLAMFAMVAVAFVVMTGAEKRNSVRLTTIEQVNYPPNKDLNQAFNVLARGPLINATTLTSTNPNTASAVKWGSLLEKLYGYETIGSPSLPAKMSTITVVGKGQLLEFILPTTPPDPTTYSSQSIDQFRCVGCVLTMLSGRCAGHSTHIVGINPTNYNVQMAAFEGGIQPANGDSYIVNGFPYSGLGFGFSSGSISLTGSATLPNMQPIASAAQTQSWPMILLNGKPTGIIMGGVNADNTVADYTDPLPAMEAPNPNNSGATIVAIPSLHRSDLIQYWINLAQSQGTPNPLTNAALLRQIMFRPNWLDNPNFTGSNPSGLFTQNSPNFNPAWDGVSVPQGKYFTWDVDNRGTGTPDSVWVDLGLPVRYTADGRAYKPLFAILCLDMDGRLNINAHGSYAQTQTSYYQQMFGTPLNVQPAAYQRVVPQDTGLGSTPQQIAYVAGQVGQSNASPPVALPRGEGTGVAEVNPLPLFRNLMSPTNFYQGNFQAVLSGSGQVMGRYGSPAPGAALPVSGPPSALPGINSTGSYLTINNAFSYTGMAGGNSNYWSNFQTQPYDAFGTPPDTQTLGTVVLDRAGRPLYISLGGPVVNSPYDSDITRNAAHAADLTSTPDNPFGVAEWERIIRCYDRDAPTLPPRLLNLTSLPGGGSFLQNRRAEFTVESHWVPVAPGVLPAPLRFALQRVQPGSRATHPVDVLTGKIALSTGNVPAPSTLNAMRLQLLPWEILEGLKMDLNRPFGAGPYSQGGSLIQGGVPTIPDQPGTTNEQLPQYTSVAGGTVTHVPFSYAADGGQASKVNDSLAARQLYARHLYVLALALSDTQAILNDLQSGMPPATPPGQKPTADDAVRVIAQWAVNVVAYRDHNGIMIPFAYDPNPFTANGGANGTGWNPPNTPKYTVWGCKRPELVISETLAFHDRRTQDRNDEKVDPRKVQLGASPQRVNPGYTSNYNPPTTDPKSIDPSFNSHFRPQGSLFVELYNPWTILEPHTTDLGPDQNGLRTNPNGGVQLNKISAASGTQQSSPVWRLVIVDPSWSQNTQTQAPNTAPINPPANGDELPDADNPTVSMRPYIERVAYFVPLSSAPNYPKTDDHGNPVVSYCPTAAEFPSSNPNAALVVPPSGYAVVGSGDAAEAKSTRTTNRTFIGFANGQTTGQPATTRMVTLNTTDVTAVKPNVVQSPGAAPPFTAVPPQLLGIDFNQTNNIAQRLSVSEPTEGYQFYESPPGLPAAAYNATGANYGTYTNTLDIPTDAQRYLLKPKTQIFNGTSIWTWLNNNGTIPAFRIIYLQRLADPTRPFVAESTGANTPNPPNCNPYRTVDSMTVDLTTFNGVTSNTTDLDPTATNSLPNMGVPTGYHFEARQRGEWNYLPLPGNTRNEMNIWKQEPASKSPTAVAWIANKATPKVPINWVNGGATPTGNMYFNKPLTQTLGYLNQPFGQPAAAPAAGDPQYPFPWLQWSYRPFNNEYELLLVPALPSSRLLARAVLPNSANPNPYSRRGFGYDDGYLRSTAPAPDVYSGAMTSPAPINSRVPFPHLLNLFESNQSSGPLQSTPVLTSQLHRILAYVGVPSRFANAQVQVRADLAAGTGTPANLFHPPYNKISRYREPGRINLNTVTSPDVLFGLMNTYYPALQVNSQLTPVFWDKFVRSRRGDGTSPSLSPNYQQSLMNMFTINPKVPSRFMHPYRSPGGEPLVPQVPGVSEPQHETDVTLLRTDPDVANRPLFQYDDYLFGLTSNYVTTNVGGTPDNFPLACIDYNRNPTFRYQVLQKMGNSVSTHSNVFAIWITVGYFEVTSAGATNAVYPDGYQLGQELGADSGDIVRHRAFFLFDRSIPMGFVRGQDINHERGLLVKRYIE